jgi:NAD-dependent deacetylase
MDKVLQQLKQANSIVVMTGAGCSAESGIPTFRDAMSGLWAKYNPEDLATAEAFQRDPKLVWDWYAWRRGLIAEASPNPAHHALVELAGLRDGFTLITQNVDNLHQEAGQSEVIELHGNISRCQCFDCGEIAHWFSESEQSQLDGVTDHPLCRCCNGLLRPDVVWFGEQLPPAAMSLASERSRSADVFISVGTSSVVYPAAGLAELARENGATIVEVNLAETPLSATVDFCLQGPAGQILSELVRKLKS